VTLTRLDIGERFAAIVGAPRCGTTSLARYLESHPEVDFSFVKEPHFFSQHDLTGLDDDKLLEAVEQEYLARYFSEANSDERMLMEGSVTYLYTPEQMEPILRLWPEAKFIIAVRDPFDMLPSLHQRLLFIGDETEKDFERAWKLAPQRAQGNHIPRTCIEPKWLLYPEIGKLGTYVDRFFRAVGRERCHVVVFDDFAANPAAVYREVLAFLGLPDDRRTDFAPRRGSRAYRFGWLQRLLKRPPKRVRLALGGQKFRQRFKKIDEIKPDPPLVSAILRWRRQLLRWNKILAPVTKLSPEMQARMHDAFAPDIIHLARLLRRDLSDWLGGVPEANMEPPAREAASLGA
jgi:sulfotransferase family protein